ncbi:MAG: DUF1553 domain-containing protein, partial [Planctomycetales bacterium]|nr:DUF1553 domain-containing protein [Planctomycetales bacterium]
ADTSPQRWTLWVERFLADPLCDEHLVQVLDRMLMMRRSYTQVDRAAWISYLREQVTNDTPLDQLTQQLLAAPWWHCEQRASQRFYLDRAGDPNLIARDLGRVFLGRDLQCAQCHDHPQIDDYRQTDYHGLLAFFAPSKLADAVAKDAEGKDVTVQLYVELPAGDAPFESVFNTGVPYRSGPRLPEQTELLEEYVLPDQRLQCQAPADALAGVPPPPQHSRRQLLAEQLTARSNDTLVSNWANRWWAQIFGQGLVHPVDMQHVDNPPSHPELYQLIAQGLLESDMQPRRFIAQLVQTEAYQRGGWTTLQATNNAAVPLELSDEQSRELRQWATAQLRELVDNQTGLSEQEASAQAAYETATEIWEEVQGQRAVVRAELDPAEATLIGEQKKAADAAKLLTAAEKTQTDTNTQVTLLEEALAKLQQAAVVSGQEDPDLKPAIDATSQRLAAAREKLPSINQQVVDAQTACDSSGVAVQSAKEIVEQIVGRLQPIQQALRTADTSMLAARRAWHQAYWRLADSKRRSECHLHTLAWLDGLTELKRLDGDSLIAVQELASLQAELSTISRGFEQSQAELTAARDAQQAVDQQCAEIQQRMDAHAANQALLQHSVDALAASFKLVSSTEPLQAAQDVILAELQLRSGQVGQMQSDLSAAQAARVTAIVRTTDLEQQCAAHSQSIVQVTQQLAAARDVVAERQSKLTISKDSSSELWSAVSQDAARNLSVARLSPLSPEQLCWSTLRITGQLDNYIQAEIAELEKSSPSSADADASARRRRQQQAVRAAFDKLRSYADVFVSLYASGPDKTQDDFFASVDQALYTANSGSVFAWAGPSAPVTRQAIETSDDALVAEELYGCLLCRPPTDIETELVKEQLVGVGEGRAAVIQEMVWSLLASAEFRFSY